MKNFVLRQPDPEVTLGCGERVAEADIRKPVHKDSEFDDDIARRNLLIQRAGWNAGGDPGGHHGRIDAKLLNAVSGQNRRKAEFCHTGAPTALRMNDGRLRLWR